MKRNQIVSAALLAFMAGTAAAQQGLKEEDYKNLQPVDVRRERVNETYFQPRYTGNQDRIIYGSDDREDVYEVTDPFLLGLAQAGVAVCDVSELTDNGDGTFTLNTGRWTAACTNEPFYNQMRLGFCSGFLVGTDLIVTAGHCVSPSDVGDVAFVFQFDQQAAGTGPGADPEVIVPADHVYFLTQVVDYALGSGEDHAVCRVDRAVAGRTPLPVRRTGSVSNGDPLVMIGHPAVLPKKIEAGGEVKDANGTTPYFMANVDAYGGNSGSMVLNRTTGVIEGILVRGNTDYVSGPGGCLLSNQCPDSGCPTWEEISKTTSFASFIPELGLQFTPNGSITHIGTVGGPFNDETFQININNPTSDPADYSVSIDIGAEHTVLLNGSGGPVTGTVPGSGSASVTATLSGAAGMPAGIYETTINLEDLTNGRSVSLLSTLEVGQTGITVSPATDLVTGGPNGGPFNGTQLYTITSTRPTPVAVDITPDQPWITLNGATGPTSVNLSGTGDMAVVTVGIGGNAASLSNGLYTGSVMFDNTQSVIGDTSRGVSLDVGRYLYEDSPAIAISDNSSYSTTIDVPDGFCIADIDVELDISHTYIGDLIVELESPEGTVVRLHDRSGGGTDNLVVTYDDDGGSTPDGPGVLADYETEIATGTWTLRFSDNAGQDTGILNSWALRIASQSGGCLPVANDVEVDVPANALATVMLDGQSVNGPFVYIIESLPAHGELFIPGGARITSVPTTLPGDSVSYRPDEFYAGVDMFDYSTDDGASSGLALVTTNVGSATLADFNMDTNPGWTTTGQWAFGVPAGIDGDPTSGHTGSNVYGYNLSGEYTDNMPEYPLTTGVIDASGASNVTLEFQRWLGVENSTYDHASIEVFDGSSWQQIWDHTATSSFTDSSWQAQSFDISAHADGNANLQIRWIMGTTDTSVTYCGWNIDDVVLKGLVVPASGYCLADTNGDGSVSPADFSAWVAAFNAGNAAVADQNLDGVVSPADFSAWVSNYNAGCL